MTALSLHTAPHLSTVNPFSVKKIRRHIPGHQDDIGNIATFRDDITLADYRRFLGSEHQVIQSEYKISPPSGQKIGLYPLQHADNEISIGDFKPCAVLLNNDLSGGQFFNKHFYSPD